MLHFIVCFIAFKFKRKMLHLQGRACVFSEVDVHLIKCQINCTMKDDSCVSGYEHSTTLNLISHDI